MAEVVRAVPMFVPHWEAARMAWRTTDPALYAATPPEPVERIIEDMPTAFGALVRAILHQQVSIYAGRAIITRFVEACGGTMEPEPVLQLSDDDLRRVGLSRPKIVYVRALAEAAASGTLEDLECQPDEEITTRLVRLPGIGIWTVKMFLIFHLQRPDVFCGLDLGLREGIRALDSLPEPPTPARADERAAVWAPYRSVAAVVLWDFLRRTRAEKQGLRAEDSSPSQRRNERNL